MNLLAVLSVALAALSSSPLALAQSVPTNPVPELRKGERFFRIDGTPAFVLGRNPVGVNAEAFQEHFQKAAAAGERFMRIHFTYSPAGEKAGEIDPGMLKMWDAALDAAEKTTWPCFRCLESGRTGMTAATAKPGTYGKGIRSM